MPKTKKLDDSESSGSESSGPRDRNPPPSKKSKTDSAKSSSSSSGSKSKKEDDTWELDKKRVVKINNFRGRIFIDIREYYEDQSGDLKPGKKGISLSTSQYQKLKEVIPEIDEALKNQ